MSPIRLFFGTLLIVSLAFSLRADDTADESEAVKTFAQTFFERYAEKDLDRFMALWSPGSPSYEFRQGAMKNLFGETGPIEARLLKFYAVESSDSAARLEFQVELKGHDVKTGKPYVAFGVMNRMLSLIREEGDWKVQQYGPVEPDWAFQLASAGSVAERTRLLEQRPEWASMDTLQELRTLAQNQRRQGKLDLAQQLVEIMFELTSKLNLPPATGTAWLTRGEIEVAVGKFDDAAASFQKSLQFIEGDRAESIVVELYIADAWHQSRQFEREFEVADNLRKRIGEPQNESETSALALASYFCGEALWGLRRGTEAIACYEESLQKYTTLGGTQKNVAEIHNRVGLLLNELHQYDAAASHLDLGITAAVELKETLLEAQCRYALSRAFQGKGQLEDALMQGTMALELAEKSNGHPQQILALTLIAELQQALGRTDKGRQSLQSGIQRVKQWEQSDKDYAVSPEAGQATITLAIALFELKQYREALAEYERSLRIAIRNSDVNAEATARGGRGNALRSLKRNAEAVVELRRASDLYQQSGMRHMQGAMLLDLGRAEAVLEKFPESKATLLKTIEILKQIEELTAMRIDALFALSYTEQMLGDYANAVQMVEEACVLAETRNLSEKHVRALYNLGTAQEKMGNRTAARTTYDKALKLARVHRLDSEEMSILEREGDLFAAETNFDMAIQSFSAALKLARELKDEGQVASLLQKTAAIYYPSGDYTKALELLDEAIEITGRLTGDELTEVSVRLAHASVLMLQRRFSEAVPEFRALADFERKTNANTHTGLMMLAFTYEQMAEYGDAEKTLDEMLRRARNKRNVESQTWAYLGLGRLRIRQQQHARALSDLQTALRLADDQKNRDTTASVNKFLGIAMAGTGDVDAGRLAIQKSVNLFRDLGKPYEMSEAMVALAELEALVGNYKQAISSYQAALTVQKRLQSDRAANVINGMGMVLMKAGETQKAEAAFLEALEDYRRRGARYEEAFVLHNLGMLYNGQGNYTKGEPLLKDTLRIGRELKQRDLQLRALQNLGVAESEIGNFPEAINYFEQAQTLARDLEDPLMTAMASGARASVFGRTGQTELAVKELQQAIVEAETIGVGDTTLQLRDLLANIYMESGMFLQAESLYNLNLQHAREFHRPAYEAATLNNLSIVYAQMGKYADALRSLQTVLEIARRIENPSAEALARQNFAMVYHATGKITEAISELEQCLQYYRATGLDRRAAVALIDLEMLYFVALDGEKFKDAAAEIDDVIKQLASHNDNRGLRTLTTRQAGILVASGFMLQAAGQPAEQSSDAWTSAARFLESNLNQSRAENDTSGEAEVLQKLGMTYMALGRRKEALKAYEEALRLPSDSLDPRTSVYCWNGLGDVHRADQNWSPAADAYREATSRLELLRSETEEQSLQTSLFGRYLSAWSNPYQSLAECLVEMDEYPAAFAETERAKARTLVDLLDTAKIRLTEQLSLEEKNQERLLETRLVSLVRQQSQLASSGQSDRDLGETLSTKLTEARAELAAFETQIYLAHPELQIQRAEFAPANLAEIQTSLFAKNPGLCVLSYVVGKDDVRIFVLSAGTDAAELHECSTRVPYAELNAAVENLRRDYRRPGALISADPLELWLLQPAAEFLKGKTHLVIIPDGPLHTLPFQAIPDSEGKYLIEKFAVSYAPSVTALVKMMAASDRRETLSAQSTARSEGTILAVGRPDFQGRLKDLKASSEEVLAIAKLFPQSPPPLIGAAATESAVKQRIGQATYLHFATHGLLNESAPMYSSVALSEPPIGEPDPDNDARLEARELFGLQLEARLAVLSACKTALGQQSGGEGLLGMTWALFVAGVPTTVATQWSVDDQSTQMLMIEFYGRLTAPPVDDVLNTAEALRQAQLKLLHSDQYSHPFYWAPFVLVGDPR
jgi:CHAT domain-containing protein/Flp pilus assembly protein TadD